MLDNYDYVGPNKGSYSYECSSSGNLSVDNGILSVCNLASGDYQLYGIPAEGMCIKPLTASNTYTQNVRLGASDLRFELDIMSCPEEIVEIPAPPSCERGTYVEGSNQCVLVMQYEEYNDGRPDKYQAAVDKCSALGMSILSANNMTEQQRDQYAPLLDGTDDHICYWVDSSLNSSGSQCSCLLYSSGNLSWSQDYRSGWHGVLCVQDPQ